MSSHRAPKGSVSEHRIAGGGIRFRVRLTVGGARKSLGLFATRAEADDALAFAVAATANGGTLRKADADRCRSFVYFIQDGEAGAIKIGRAKNPTARLYAMQTGSAGRRMRLLCAVPGGPRLEVALQSAFAGCRMANNGEWFEPTDELMRLVDELQSIWTVSRADDSETA